MFLRQDHSPGAESRDRASGARAASVLHNSRIARARAVLVGLFIRFLAFSAMQVPAERPDACIRCQGPRSRLAARPAVASTGITPLLAGPPPSDACRVQMFRYQRTGRVTPAGSRWPVS